MLDGCYRCEATLCPGHLLAVALNFNRKHTSEEVLEAENELRYLKKKQKSIQKDIDRAQKIVDSYEADKAIDKMLRR